MRMNAIKMKNGDGVPMNKREEFKYFKIAVDRGEKESKKYLQKFEFDENEPRLIL